MVVVSETRFHANQSRARQEAQFSPVENPGSSPNPAGAGFLTGAALRWTTNDRMCPESSFWLHPVARWWSGAYNL
jgi:hypothetical protein